MRMRCSTDPLPHPHRSSKNLVRRDALLNPSASERMDLCQLLLHLNGALTSFSVLNLSGFHPRLAALSHTPTLFLFLIFPLSFILYLTSPVVSSPHTLWATLPSPSPTPCDRHPYASPPSYPIPSPSIPSPSIGS